MEDYPITLLEFEKRFATEEACRQYFFKLRWPEGFRCPSCGSQKAWLTERNLYHCGHCGTQTSLFSGTIFQDTKKPLQQWFNAIWHITNQKYGANAMGLQRILGLGSYRTSWVCLHKLRRAMVRPGRDRLSGVVEVISLYTTLNFAHSANSHDEVHDSLKADPKRFGAGLAIAFAPQKPAETGNDADDLVEFRRRIR